MFSLSENRPHCIVLDLILWASTKKKTVGNEPWIHHKVIMATSFCHRLEKQNGSKWLLPLSFIHWIWMYSLPPGHTHTQWKEMPVYICIMCRCTRVKMKMWMQALVWFVGRMDWLICHLTFFPLLYGLMSVLSQTSLVWSWGPFGSL